MDSYEGETLYTYDALGQLLSETKNACPGSDCGTTVAVTYDNYGNITSKNGVSYTYGNVLWHDRLTGYGDKTITYDAQGNPVNYLGHNLTWGKGRQLKSFDGNTYTYNASGIRTSKTVDNVRHDYLVDGGRILKETWLDNVLVPIYNNEQEVVGIYYNCTPYYFYKDLQGDVIGISDTDGRAVVAYTYDAWGVCTVLHDHTDFGLANINPYRYRSYYFDSEIGMYYLQSRYYDPVVGRFVNADEVVQLDSALGSNLYAYCEDNPVIYKDTTGYGKTYSIYYNNPGSGFDKQAKNSPYYNSKKVNFKSVISIKDFQDAWSSMSGTIDYLYLYLHGGKGTLYFKGETMFMEQIKNLASKKVRYRVYLFSCYGGHGKEGSNVAWEIAKLTSSKVFACTGSVSYSKIFGKYYARKAWDWGYIKTFYHEKKYIWWGAVVAKSRVGQW